MSVATLEELEAVPIGQTVTVNANDRTGQQTWTRSERGLRMGGNEVPLGSFVGAITAGLIEATGRGMPVNVGDVWTGTDGRVRVIRQVAGPNPRDRVNYDRYEIEGRAVGFEEHHTFVERISSGDRATMWDHRIEAGDLTTFQKMCLNHTTHRAGGIGVLAANNPVVDHGYEVGQRIGTPDFINLPVGTKMQGNGDSRHRTIVDNEGNYTYDDDDGQIIRSYREDGGAFTIRELPAALAADSSAAVAGAVEQWLTDHDGHYMTAATMESLRDVLRGYGIEAQQPEREVAVEVYVEGWTEVSDTYRDAAALLVPGVDEIEDVENAATIRWAHTIQHTVMSSHPDPCQDHALINDAWVTERLNEAGIRFTGFAIEERGCDAD